MYCTKKSKFRTQNPKITHYGLEMIGWMGPSIWNLVPEIPLRRKSKNELLTIVPANFVKSIYKASDF